MLVTDESIRVRAPTCTTKPLTFISSNLHFQLLTGDSPVFPVRDQVVRIVGVGSLGISVTMFQ